MEWRASIWLRCQSRRTAAALLIVGCVASLPTASAYLGPVSGGSDMSAFYSLRPNIGGGRGTCGRRKDEKFCPERTGAIACVRRRWSRWAHTGNDSLLSRMKDNMDMEKASTYRCHSRPSPCSLRTLRIITLAPFAPRPPSQA